MEKLNYEYDFYKNYELVIKKKVYSSRGLCGLVNLGNKCFMNSILQCLNNSLKLTDYLLSNRFKEDISISSKNKSEYYVLLSYLNLINNIWDSNQLIKPKTFIENVSKFHKEYFTLNEQDSHECLIYILDLFHKSLSYEIEIEVTNNNKNKTIDDIGNEPGCDNKIISKKNSLLKEAINTWEKHYGNNYSFIIELFNGLVISDVLCKNTDCNVNCNVFEPFNSLSLSLQENTTLYDCFDEHFKKDEIVDSWKCEKCNQKGCNKNTKIWALPDYLIIHLKRFNKDMTKNYNLINFPLIDLDLTKYISPDKLDKNKYIYDCYAINYHSGTLEAGHYWSACKNLDSNWYNFNDANVSRYEKTNYNAQLITKDAYILFYHRKFIKNETLIV